MIHATNHEEGCILMNDNICKRWEALQEVQSGGQMSMFSVDVENKIFDEEEIREDLIKVLSGISDFKNLNMFLAEFISSSGVRCCTSDIKEQLRLLEKDRKIDVRREPPKTPTGKVSSFWDCKKGNKVLIRGTI
jgi:hypothetical protein